MAQKIAIIGSGMAGLAAAWTLGLDHEVTLFEKHERIGIGAHAVDIEGVRVDIPLRVIYPGYYPELFSILRESGVPVERLDASLSFSEIEGNSYFRYHNWQCLSRTIPLISPTLLLKSLPRKILFDLGRFMLIVPRDLEAGRMRGLTLAAYLGEQAYSPAFIDSFLVPCFAGINTVSNENVLNYPAELIARYFTRGFIFSSVYRAVGGAGVIAAALASRLSQTHFGAKIESVSRGANDVRVHHHDGTVATFDRVIFATQANQILPLLADASDEERNVLGSIRYSTVKLLMHRDTRLAPRDRNSWSPVNYLLSDQHDRPMITLWINALLPAYRGIAEPLFQTINPLMDADENLVLQRTTLERPIVDMHTAELLDRLDVLHSENARRVFFCGSYAAGGIPLLESAAVSAKSVARHINRG